MNITAQSFCENLQIPYDKRILPYFEKGIAKLSEKGKYIVDKERIVRLNRKYNFFRKWFDDVLSAADKIAADDELVLFTYVLQCIIEDKADVNMLEIPDRKTLETDFLPMFSLLYFLEDMISAMEKRGLPYRIISDTLQGFEAEINDYYNIFHRPGIRIYVEWFLLFVYGEIIRIGRFNFQLTTFNDSVRAYQRDGDIKILLDDVYVHKNGMLFGSRGQDDEDGKYYAEIEESVGGFTGYGTNAYGEAVPEKITLCGYKEFLRRGDSVIHVHIPAEEPFTKELCDESFAEARVVFKKYYPEYKYKAFCCSSWMLEKRLRDILGKDTNITRFADRFVAFPRKSAATDVITFLFHIVDKVDLKDLPERSSMQKKVKDFLLNGGIFYDKSGIML